MPLSDSSPREPVKGWWWLPKSPSEKIPGTLEWRDGHPELNLWSVFSEVHYPFPHEPAEIHGESLNEGKYTLLALFSTGYSHTSQYIPKWVIEGTHCHMASKVRRQWLYYDTLYHWHMQSGIRVTRTARKQKAFYAKPRAVAFPTSYGKVVLDVVSFGFMLGVSPRREVVTEQTVLQIRFSRSQAITDAATFPESVEIFVRFCTAKPIAVDREVWEIQNGRKRETATIINRPPGIFPYTGTADAWEMTLPIHQAFNRSDLFENWNRVYKQYPFGLDVLIGRSIDEPANLDSEFLAMAQAFEARSRVHTGQAGELAVMLKKARARVPDKMSWLKLDDGKIALAIRTRNYLTHRNPKDKKGAATEKETFLLSHILRCMFEINVLTDLQFSKDDIVNLLDKNQRYAHIREELAHRKINPTSFPRGI